MICPDFERIEFRLAEARSIWRHWKPEENLAGFSLFS